MNLLKNKKHTETKKETTPLKMKRGQKKLFAQMCIRDREHFLSQHPEITEIEVCTDNDFAGRWACEHIRKAYEGNYQIIENLPEIEGADWADMAKKAARTLEKRQNREAR